MSNNQLELGLDTARQLAQQRRRENRATRAAWWFTQMRQIVSQAIDWENPPAPRPEQPWLGFTQSRSWRH